MAGREIIIDNEGVWWEVESIRGFKVEERGNGKIKLSFLLKWTGFPECTWERYDSFDDNTKRLANQFINSHIMCLPSIIYGSTCTLYGENQRDWTMDIIRLNNNVFKYILIYPPLYYC